MFFAFAEAARNFLEAFVEDELPRQRFTRVFFLIAEGGIFLFWQQRSGLIWISRAAMTRKAETSSGRDFQTLDMFQVLIGYLREGEAGNIQFGAFN